MNDRAAHGGAPAEQVTPLALKRGEWFDSLHHAFHFRRSAGLPFHYSEVVWLAKHSSTKLEAHVERLLNNGRIFVLSSKECAGVLEMAADAEVEVSARYNGRGWWLTLTPEAK